MSDKYIPDDKLDKQSHNRKSDEHFYLTEKDFYPPEDNRVLKSYVEDVEGGDNFADYCEYIFDLLEEEGYYDQQ